MNFLNKLLFKAIQKTNQKHDNTPIEKVDETADGLEKKIRKQLRDDELDEKTRKSLENVLSELDNYRNEHR